MQRNETGSLAQRCGGSSKEPDKENLYWKIPRDKMSINYFLVRSGYKIKEILESYVNNDDVYATNSDGDETNQVGLISKDSSLITVQYSVYEEEDLRSQLRFRNILDENGIEYAESPPREVAAGQLREYSKRLNELSYLVERE